MGIFGKKKNKEITMRIYQTNRKTYGMEDGAENAQPEEVLPIPDLQPYSEGIWKRCPACTAVLYEEDLDADLKVCPKCNYHFRLTARERIAQVCDPDTFEEFNAGLVGLDPLEFPNYQQKLDGIKEQTHENEAIVTGFGKIDGMRAVLAVMDGYFLMGSMGAAVGEKFALAAERAIDYRLPFIAFTVSGGARMQEGLISLMQMSKTAAVLARLDDAGLLYIAVLTDPTTGGVSASFAMLGDITIAEPNAIVGFAGRRVIEQTIKQTLPNNFQRSEFVMKKGFIDIITERKDLKKTLAHILKLHEGAIK